MAILFVQCLSNPQIKTPENSLSLLWFLPCAGTNKQPHSWHKLNPQQLAWKVPWSKTAWIYFMAKCEVVAQTKILFGLKAMILRKKISRGQLFVWRTVKSRFGLNVKKGEQEAWNCPSIVQYLITMFLTLTTYIAFLYTWQLL